MLLYFKYILKSNNPLRKSGQEGFTLIELLVVIAIIGMLATIVMFSINSARQKARDAKRISDIEQMAKTLELYFHENTAYPIATDVPLESVSGLTPAFMATLPVAPTPIDDPAGTTTCSDTGPGSCASNNAYCYNGAPDTYTITFCLGQSTSSLSEGMHYLLPIGIR